MYEHSREHVPPSTLKKKKGESFAQPDTQATASAVFEDLVVKARATLDFPLRVVAIVGSTVMRSEGGIYFCNAVASVAVEPKVLFLEKWQSNRNVKLRSVQMASGRC